VHALAPSPAESPDYTPAPQASLSTPGEARSDSPDAAWHRHRRWVAAILLAYKPRWVELDDLLQDVALTVVRHLPTLRDEGAVKPWLRTVAINAARAAGRSGKRKAHATGGEDDVLARIEGDGVEPVARASLHEEGKRLYQIASQLGDGYREPLLLKAVHGMSYREVGEVMGLPESTVETRIARARKQLRELAEAQATRDRAGAADQRA
jgi:RNA polymerase sigma-70 factor (ECF subfamily)